MRLDKVIEALRGFALDPRDVPEGMSGLATEFQRLASRIVCEYDALPRPGGQEPQAAAPVTVTLGTTGGTIVLQSSGNDEVEPSYIVWTPKQAREVAAKLLELARALELHL